MSHHLNHLNHLISHVSRTIPASLNHPPPLLSATHSIFGLGLKSFSPLDLEFSASHHLNHPTSHVLGATPTSLNHPPPLLSVMHLIFSLGSKSLSPLDLKFSALHHLNHPTSHVPKVTPASLNHHPPLSSATHLIFGLGGQNCLPLSIRVLHITPLQPPQLPHLPCPQGHPRKFKSTPTVIECVTLDIWFGAHLLILGSFPFFIYLSFCYSIHTYVHQLPRCLSTAQYNTLIFYEICFGINIFLVPT